MINVINKHIAVRHKEIEISLIKVLCDMHNVGVHCDK